MTKVKNAALTLVSVAALSVPSIGMAQTGPDAAWYVGGSVGQSKIDCDTTGIAGASCDDSDTAFRVFGGYQFNRHVAVELGYSQLGEARANVGAFNVNAEAKGWDLVAVGILPVSERFSVFGKLGMHMTDLEVTSNVPGGASSESNSDLTYGVGLQYSFNKNLGLRAEWQQFKKVGDDTDVDVMSIGVVWKFK